MSRSVLVVAGEPSGDMHLAKVIRELKARDPSVRFWGIGGDRCAEEGVELVFHARDMAVIGLSEVLRRYGFFRRVFHDLLRLAGERRPDAVLLVDYPGFNLRFAEQAHALGLKVLYYICPQVWAWHRSRIRKMARIIDRLFVIFPFETEVFKDTGPRADFVGHPLVQEARAAWAAPEQPLPWPGEVRVAILPGSRRMEVERILPPMLGAARRLERENPRVGFLLAGASEALLPVIERTIQSAPERPERLSIVIDRTREILRQARAAWVASGTATIETALMRCPMIVVYKTSPLTYHIGKHLVKVPHIGMVNIVAGRELCPEFIQHKATPEALCDSIRSLVEETDARRAMLAGLESVAGALGDADAYATPARLILEELGARDG